MDRTMPGRVMAAIALLGMGGSTPFIAGTVIGHYDVIANVSPSDGNNAAICAALYSPFQAIQVDQIFGTAAAVPTMAPWAALGLVLALIGAARRVPLGFRPADQAISLRRID